ncbi:MAG: DEAD/DEAH box helicase [Arcobacter sp.]|nr:MAG: DEAD/DEAH box helicase [Arcobacter sp.]
MPFSHFNLSSSLQHKIKLKNFTKPSPIQEKVIPLVLERKDVMAKAQTGSGKSAAFILPIVNILANDEKEGKAKIRALILTPTRELTSQVAQDFEYFLPKRLKVVSVVGGEQLGAQMIAIQKGCDIVVATSGRLLEIIDKGQINLSRVEFFVLDEADKMLDLGFAQELSLLLKSMPLTRQNLMFSATYPPKVLNYTSSISSTALEVSIENEEATVGSIRQRVIKVNSDNRGPLLRYLIENEKYEQTLVFMGSKRAAHNIATKFRKYGFKAEAFHSDLDQEERNFTLNLFKDKKVKVLFATDIAARGLDIDNISCVINFDLPRSPNDYIHRIGRTGRAGAKGLAVSFIDHVSQEHFKLIEKRSGIKLEREEIEGFELTGDTPTKIKGPAPLKGKKKSKKDKLREEALKNKEK